MACQVAEVRCKGWPQEGRPLAKLSVSLLQLTTGPLWQHCDACKQVHSWLEFRARSKIASQWPPENGGETDAPARRVGSVAGNLMLTCLADRCWGNIASWHKERATKATNSSAAVHHEVGFILLARVTAELLTVRLTIQSCVAVNNRVRVSSAQLGSHDVQGIVVASELDFEEAFLV